MLIVAQQVAMQAQMGAIIDVFKLTTWSFVAILPLVFLLLRRPAPVKAPS